MGQIQERRKKRKKIFKKTISRFNGGAQNSTYSHSLILFKRKNIKPIRKILFSPSLCFFVITFLLHYFFSFFNLHIKLEKKRNILKERKKSITNQEDGTSFPPHKMLKHLKDLKILSDPKI